MAVISASGGAIVKLHGDKELYQKLKSNRANGPVARFLDRASIFMQGQARKKAVVDTGRMRNSIGVEKPSDRLRRIGPNVDYAEHVEFGTSAHYPPLNSLWGWSKRHGVDPWALQQSIGMWGTPAQPFMQPAADETEGFMVTLVPVLAAEIESAFQ